VNAKNSVGTTALMAAAFAGHTQVVEALLSRGANANVKDAQGRTALMAAAINGVDDAAQTLIAKGADIEATE
jgi:uncharacterized protein